MMMKTQCTNIFIIVVQFYVIISKTKGPKLLFLIPLNCYLSFVRVTLISRLHDLSTTNIHLLQRETYISIAQKVQAPFHIPYCTSGVDG